MTMPDEESDSDDEIHPKVDSILTDMADELGRDKAEIVQFMDAMYDIDVTELDDEQAEKFETIYEDHDVELARELLSDLGLSEEDIESFVNEIQAASNFEGGSDDADAAPAGNGQSPSPQPSGGASAAPSGGEGGLTEAQRAEVAQIVQHSTPSADEIVSQLEEKMGGGGGGGAVAQDEQSQLGSLISLAELFSGGGGGMGELGEQFHKAALNSYIKKLNRPSMGEIVEMRMYEKMADDVADEYVDEYFEDPFEGLDAEDDE